MSYPKALLFSAVIVACAVIFASVSPVSSQTSGGGRFMIAGDGSQFIWRINTETGAIDYCVRRDNSADPGLIQRRPPYCSAATPALN